MKTRPNAIPSASIRKEDIPSEYKSWNDIIQFAATFDPSSENSAIAMPVGIDHITAESSIRDIRAALFFEYRRYNHLMCDPSKETFAKCIDALSLLKSKAK